MISLEEIGRRRGLTLRVLRTHRGLSQKRLGELSGVNKSTIASYESGRRSAGMVSRLKLLAALGISERAWQTTCQYVEVLDALSGVEGGGEFNPLLSYAARLLGKEARALEREPDRGMAEDELLRRRGREIAGRVL